MKILAFVGAIAITITVTAVCLHYGGFINPTANVELTQEGIDTFNKGINVVQEKVNSLKVTPVTKTTTNSK